MNAMEAAKVSNWKESATFLPSLALPVSTERVAVFNGQLAIDPSFLDQVSKDSAAILAEYGFPQWTAHIPARLDELQLTRVQRQELTDVLLASNVAAFKDRDEMLRALEGNLKGSAHAQPMLAALILVVVVAVFLWVIHAQIP
jgi:hypothetical protein